MNRRGFMKLISAAAVCPLPVMAGPVGSATLYQVSDVLKRLYPMREIPMGSFELNGETHTGDPPAWGMLPKRLQ